MRITSRGQVTIPLEVRRRAGLMPGTDVEFRLEDGTVRLVKAGAKSRKTRGRKAVERATGTATSGLTTAEILAMFRGE